MYWTKKSSLLRVALLIIALLATNTVEIFATKLAGEKKVTLSNFQFSPQTITIKAGDIVVWENKEGAHTVTADDNSWESPTLNAGQTFTHKFDKPGTYRYHCSFHGSAGGGMAGVVKVTR